VHCAGPVSTKEINLSLSFFPKKISREQHRQRLRQDANEQAKDDVNNERSDVHGDAM
jgi:hypothetical protein